MTQETAIEYTKDERRMVIAALEQMLQSPLFRTSKQCQNLLRYLVLQTLSGEQDALRERVIGVEVFGRRPDYDTSSDPVVRVRAADLRKRMVIYYAQRSDTSGIRITIPSGSYRPLIAIEHTELHGSELSLPEWKNGSSAENNGNLGKSAGPKTDVEDIPMLADDEQFGRARLLKRWVGVLAVLAIFVTGMFFLVRTRQPAALDRFWSPMLQSNQRLLLYTGGSSHFTFSEDYAVKYRKDHHIPGIRTSNRTFAIPLDPQQNYSGADFQVLANRFVSIGDAAAAATLTSFLSEKKKNYDLRFDQDIDVGDLRQQPVVLIGGYNNDLTLEWTDPLRFAFARGLRIRDRQRPQQFWQPNADGSDDYAVITRILRSNTGQPFITVAGLGQAGTWAAGEFLTDASALEAFSRGAPKGWEKKNIQIVLRTSVMNGSPGKPQVVIANYW